MDLCLKNKIVLITGSGHGLGKVTARSFLDEGAKVVISDNKKSRLDDTLREFVSIFGHEVVDSFCGDLTNINDIGECINFVVSRFNKIDICVANLGSGKGIQGWDIPEDEWKRMMSLNFDGARIITNCVLPYMKEKNGGSILFISSIAGLEVIGAPVQYSVAKAALIAYSKNISRLVGSSNIRINTVCPGNIFFENGTWDIKMKENKNEVTEMLNRSVPLKRFAAPEEISDLVLFLCSDKSSFITGSCIIADGGQTISF